MSQISSALPVLNFQKWIDENRAILKPPVANKLVWKNRDFDVMVVGGPNSRTDFHINQSEEFFYQIEGQMNLRIMDEGKPKDIPIHAGEIFLLPPNVPHCPQRPANSIGLVIERKRLPHEKDGLRWYCQRCHHPLYEEFFQLTDIETQLPPVFNRFFGNPANCKCLKCGQEHHRSTAQKDHQ